MADFSPAIERVLEHEGAYWDNPRDPGGPTHYGISLRWLAKQGLLGDYDDDGDVDVDDIRAMAVDDAIQLYKVHWWERYSYGLMRDQRLATKLLDMAVNMGPYRAHKLAQWALRACQQTIAVDGIIGPRTRAALNAVHPPVILAALRAEQAAFYRGLNKPEFQKGWLRRAYSL